MGLAHLAEFILTTISLVAVQDSDAARRIVAA